MCHIKMREQIKEEKYMESKKAPVQESGEGSRITEGKSQHTSSAGALQSNQSRLEKDDSKKDSRSKKK